MLILSQALVICRNSDLDAESELCATVQVRLALDLTLHTLDHGLAEGQAETDTRALVVRRGLRLAEHLKKVLLLLLRHSFA